MKVFKVKNQGKNKLFCTVEMDVNIDYFVYLKYEYSNKPYFHF